MAHFMLPGFIRIVDELPKTPTRKVQKNLLKEAGITPDTRDCEVAGITVKREKNGIWHGRQKSKNCRRVRLNNSLKFRTTYGNKQ